MAVEGASCYFGQAVGNIQGCCKHSLLWWSFSEQTRRLILTMLADIRHENSTGPHERARLGSAACRVLRGFSKVGKQNPEFPGVLG